MVKAFINTCLFIFFLFSPGFHSKQKSPNNHLFTLIGRAQGTTYTIMYIHDTPVVDSSEIHSILREIDQSLSLYQSTSLISQFNLSNRGVRVDDHLLDVVRKSLSVNKLSLGCFDITAKPISMLWGFNASMPHYIPSEESIKKTLKLVGSTHLSFRHDSLIKNNPKVMIDCDGIAQGYTVDQIALFLRKKGIADYMVELGGEVYASGKNIEGNDWIIGIEQPSLFSGDEQFIGNKISLSGRAVTTSGSMKKFRKLGNRYWSHIVDPRSAMPVNNGIVSVSVISSDAMTADAFDNAFMVMGVHKAISLANSFNDMGLYMVYVSKDGSLSDTCNAYFKSFMLPR